VVYKVLVLVADMSLSKIKVELEKIGRKYGMSWGHFYYYAEVTNDWKPLLGKATPEEILDDLMKLFELDEEYQRLTGKSLLKPLDEKWHG